MPLRAARAGTAFPGSLRGMSHFPSVPTPLELDDVQRIRASAGQIRLRLSGRWLAGEAPGDADEALLVVQLDGRRHRFAPEPETESPARGRWGASFQLPAWAEPRRDGQAALWIGEAVIPLPPVGVARRQPGSGPSALGSAVPADLPVEPVFLPDPAPSPEPAVAEADPGSLPGASETPRSGPLADILLKETVAALHGELEARAGEAARLRSALAGAQSELEARTESQGALEGTLSELGAELRRLMEAVEEQRGELERSRVDGQLERAEFERRLAELTATRDAEAVQLATMREELAAARDAEAAGVDAVREELAVVREELTAESRELQAHLQAAETRAQRTAAEAVRFREELASAQVAGEASRSEAAGLTAELERLGTELAITRERVQSESGDLGEANRLLADARALAEQLRGSSTGR